MLPSLSPSSPALQTTESSLPRPVPNPGSPAAPCLTFPQALHSPCSLLPSHQPLGRPSTSPLGGLCTLCSLCLESSPPDTCGSDPLTSFRSHVVIRCLLLIVASPQILGTKPEQHPLPSHCPAVPQGHWGVGGTVWSCLCLYSRGGAWLPERMFGVTISLSLLLHIGWRALAGARKSSV